MFGLSCLQRDIQIDGRCGQKTLLERCAIFLIKNITFVHVIFEKEFFEQSPSHIHEEINRESNLNPFPPIAGAQPLNGLPGALNSPLSLLVGSLEFTLSVSDFLF